MSKYFSMLLSLLIVLSLTTTISCKKAEEPTAPQEKVSEEPAQEAPSTTEETPQMGSSEEKQQMEGIEQKQQKQGSEEKSY